MFGIRSVFGERKITFNRMYYKRLSPPQNIFKKNILMGMLHKINCGYNMSPHHVLGTYPGMGAVLMMIVLLYMFVVTIVC